ncbi:alkaline phosphatase D family protein [Actinomadura litoris]|uniref:Alkaline phosphatase n=1 Tax=Actinomadura litoris TaxID=2678616 RepID=A0A7K1KUX2_9ACTN|nr:alkaline phosphatase D family protein [Actinomadura litoris]MUN35981.1 alkaline phosphatase [Actinomadura litoris]
MGAVSRRGFLGFGGAAAAALVVGTGVWGAAGSRAFAEGRSLFTLGIASGDPAPDGFVLWTRLAPDPFAPDGRAGMPDRPVKVEYEVALDEGFRQVVRRGAAVATPEFNHSVHPEIWGLPPGREYFYRFRACGQISPVGRTRTMPPVTADPASLSFAFASCQAWGDGYYTAYDHIADEDIELVVHLGDYIYETEITDSNLRGVTVPAQFGTEAKDLARYRIQYSLYKAEAPLQKAHARFPWIVTLDDHEVVNDWAGDTVILGRDPNPPPEVFAARKAAAFQAFYENLPLRRAQMPDGPRMRLHRRLPYGRLAAFTMIDTRSYRDTQACGVAGPIADCDERLDPARTLLGAPQREWLLEGFRSSGARWHVLGNQAPMTETDWDPGPAKKLAMDPWDGYAADRAAVLGAAHDRGVRNLVAITGDRHQNYACDLKRDFNADDSPTVAGEFVGTSLTRGGNGADMTEEGRRFLAGNPHMSFFNGQRGYVRVDVDRERWRSDFRVLPFVQQPGAPVSTRASFVVEDGKPGVQAV